MLDLKENEYAVLKLQYKNDYEIAKALGISRPTLIRWKKAVKNNELEKNHLQIALEVKNVVKRFQSKEKREEYNTEIFDEFDQMMEELPKRKLVELNPAMISEFDGLTDEQRNAILNNKIYEASIHALEVLKADLDPRTQLVFVTKILELAKDLK